MSEKLFNVGIKAVIVNGDKVLILKNAKRKHDVWEFPGGRMDADETIEETLQRELTEELPNIKNIRVGALLGAHRLHNDIKPDVSLVLIFYKVEAEFESEIELSAEHIDYKWMGLHESSELGGEKIGQLAGLALGQTG